MKHTLLHKIFLLTALTMVGSGALTAQRYLISGQARNAKSGTALELISAALLRADSTGVSATLTDEQGQFDLKAKGPGQYIVKLSGVGYTTTYKNVTLAEGCDSLQLGSLAVSSKENILGMATVSATVAKVEQKEDTTVYNAAAYRVPEGSTLEALVKQLPGVDVSDDGTIKYNGKEVKEFLVNGKDFFKGDTKTAMKNLPTELVSKIKAYDKVSDYTEQTGIDDGNETTVLDIATKRELNESWVTNLDVAYGNKDRYSTRAFATRFTDKSRITAYGSANNTNDRGFGGPRGFGGSSGLTASKSAGIDFSWENGKQRREAGRLELGGNMRYNHSSSDAITVSSSETFLSSGSTSSFSNSSNINKSSSTNVNGSLRLQWALDSMTTLSVRPSFTHSQSRNRGSSLTGSFNANPYAIDDMASPLDSIFADNINPLLAAIAVNRNSRLSKGDSKSTGVSGSVDLTRLLSTNGRNISLHGEGGYTQSKSHSYSISDIRYFSSNREGDFVNQYSDNPSKNWNYAVKVGYVEPLGHQWFGEVNYTYSHKYSDSDHARYNLADSLGGEWADRQNYPAIGTLPTLDELVTYARDDYNSQFATYKYDNQTVTAGVRYNTSAIRFNAGVELNPERTKMDYVRPGQGIDTVVTRKVFNVSPQVRLRYNFSKTTRLDIRYRGSSSQPSMTDLLAVVDNSDPLNISMGNPGLKPSWTNNLRAFFNTYNATYQRGIMGGLNFSQTRNSISNRMIYDETTGVRYTRPENISGNWNANGDFMFNTGLGAQKLYTISTSTRLSYSNAVGYVSRMSDADELGAATLLLDNSYDSYNRIFDAVNSSKNTTRTLGVNENLNLGYRTSMFDVALTGTVNYQHARATLQENANMDTWNYSYGASTNVNLDWGMSISTDLRMSSRRGYAASSMNTNELLWNAQVAQSFLKGKRATVSLQFYDILHQQSNVSRTLSATMRSDSWNNAINSYFLVHFIYRLNIFGGSKNGDSQGGERQGGRMGGGSMGGGRMGGMGGPGGPM
jgi:hypothetical protein